LTGILGMIRLDHDSYTLEASLLISDI